VYMIPCLKALKLLYTANQRRSSLSILRAARVTGGYLSSTDLDHHLQISGVPGEGVTDLALLMASGDLSAALAAAKGAFMPEEMPVWPEVPLDADVVPVACVTGITPVAGACAMDATRACLQNVHINPAGWAEATDGHRMYRAAIPPQPVDFMIMPLTLRLLDTLSASSVCLVGAERLFFAGDGWVLFAKRPEDPYPDIKRIIPLKDRTPAVAWDAATYKRVGDFLTRAKPFYKPKTHMVFFTDTEGATRNSELNHPATFTPCGDLFKFPDDKVLGMNAKYLTDLLKFIGKRPTEVTGGTSMISAIIWRGEGFMALQMPLRTDKSGALTRAQLIDGVKYDDV
jgi:hypothetical protein